MYKKININDEDYFYIVYHDFDYDGESIWTVFFKETEIEIRKKYLFFGPIIKKEYPKELFTVTGDIENENLTKEEVKSIIERKVELLKRKEQIKNGEII